ncbi:hypothetical protein [Oleiagrimonas sp. C23AA]|uniref:hypothetical protein n=1 Tax=Oleiagrimonas sp. C23AA TaxID=2719047 RepID=UPI00141E9D51|nr:hypothetical protein [Oleiagrimonas sp. C23AA]NII11740.1 hypothetical protein [Oleiagrimonas sp. C23AA]
MGTKITKKRARLLAQLEQIVGSNCYNGSIQNYGPGGSFEGAGRDFRYPLTVVDADGTKRKKRSPAIDETPEALSTGYYSFGANRLQIIHALNEVLEYLETNAELKL